MNKWISVNDKLPDEQIIKQHGGELKMQYEDPCLTCPKHGDTDDCVCEKWEEYEWTKMEEVAKADLTLTGV